MKGNQLNRAIITISLVGVLVSTYALYVELVAELRPGYKAICDIAEHVSCSKVLTSKYAKGLGLVPEGSSFKVPNCVYGIIFYCIIIFLTCSFLLFVKSGVCDRQDTFDQVMAVRLQIGISAMSLIICVYLAYLLIFVLKDFCVVCVCTYVINIANAFLLNKKHTYLMAKNK